MGLFGRRKLDNSAAIAPVMPRPMPGPTTIHNHSASWAGIIAVGFACFLMLFPVFWWAIVFLFEQMGSRQPGRDAAALIISIPIVAIAALILRWVLLATLKEVFDFLRDIESEKTERVRAQLLTAQTTIDPGRMNESDFEFARVILGVMQSAYEWLEREGYKTFPGRWRPWSLSSSKKTAEAMGIKLTQQRANEVSVWLSDKGVISSPDGGQITKTYPDLSNVRLLLEKEFGKPIQVVSPTVRVNRGFEFTD